jgi:hypothetical protein
MEHFQRLERVGIKTALKAAKAACEKEDYEMVMSSVNSRIMYDLQLADRERIRHLNNMSKPELLDFEMYLNRSAWISALLTDNSFGVFDTRKMVDNFVMVLVENRNIVLRKDTFGTMKFMSLSRGMIGKFVPPTASNIVYRYRATPYDRFFYHWMDNMETNEIEGFSFIPEKNMRGSFPN